MIEYKDSNSKEWLIYVLDINEEVHNYSKAISEMNDEEFTKEAELRGSVYSLMGFQQAFNNEEINSNIDLIRILYV